MSFSSGFLRGVDAYCDQHGFDFQDRQAMYALLEKRAATPSSPAPANAFPTPLYNPATGALDPAEQARRAEANRQQAALFQSRPVIDPTTGKAVPAVSQEMRESNMGAFGRMGRWLSGGKPWHQLSSFNPMGWGPGLGAVGRTAGNYLFGGSQDANIAARQAQEQRLADESRESWQRQYSPVQAYQSAKRRGMSDSEAFSQARGLMHPGDPRVTAYFTKGPNPFNMQTVVPPAPGGAPAAPAAPAAPPKASTQAAGAPLKANTQAAADKTMTFNPGKKRPDEFGMGANPHTVDPTGAGGSVKWSPMANPPAQVMAQAAKPQQPPLGPQNPFTQMGNAFQMLNPQRG